MEEIQDRKLEMIKHRLQQRKRKKGWKKEREEGRREELRIKRKRDKVAVTTGIERYRGQNAKERDTGDRKVTENLWRGRRPGETRKRMAAR